MAIIPIYKINSLQDAINIHNLICKEIDCVLDFQQAYFIRNNYLSIIGLAIEKLKENNGKHKIILPDNAKVLKAMRDIDFLHKFHSVEKGIDSHNTMIRYTNIMSDEDQEFYEFYNYFQRKLLAKVQNISKKLANKIMQKVFELFSNVFRHSNSTLGLFCSGQFYPSNSKFYFTIVDGGVGIKQNVNKYLKKKFDEDKSIFSRKKYKLNNAIECIEWAIQEGNSTTGKGGLGLALLLELIQKSDGQLEVISDDACYTIKNGTIDKKILKQKFSGTIVSIGLDTNAQNFFYLKGEGDD